MPRWTVDTWNSYRERILSMAGYVARPFFLAFTSWGFYGRGTFSLIETTRQAPLQMFLVGKVSSDSSVDPYTVIENASNANVSPQLMYLECNIVEPTIDNQLAADFQMAHKHLNSLRTSLPIPPALILPSRANHLVCLTLRPDAIQFKLPLFQSKIPWENEDLNPGLDKLIFNCPTNTQLPPLLKLRNDYQLIEANIFDRQGQQLEVNEYMKILGKTVEIVFLAQESLNDRTLNVRVKNIHLLE